VEVLVHPQSVEEIRTDNNTERREISLSKVRSYPTLESPPEPGEDSDFLTRAGITTEQAHLLDNQLLYAAYRDAIDYVITEDQALIKRAQKVQVKDKVVSINEAADLFGKWARSQDVPRPPALDEVPVYRLNLEDHIFDGLKAEYPEFVDWFRKISKQGRKCWVYLKPDKQIGALLIYKVENEPVDAEPPLPAKNRMKIATFIVTSTGNKIGELFVKLAVHYSIKNSLDELYLTHFVKPNDQLIPLISEYGFESMGKNKRGEGIFLKSLYPDRAILRKTPPVEVSQRYYPSFRDGVEVGKFLIPIRPEYHARLFVDYGNRQTTLSEHGGQFIIEGNTIKKAYLSSSRIKSLSKGDLLLFYRSIDEQQVTSIGVVDGVHHFSHSLDEVMKLVVKRTVYSRDEIAEMLKQPTMVILFRWHFHLPEPVGRDQLSEIGIAPPQSIVKIDEDQYTKIKSLGGLDERFTID
jgi:hypothetical protein